MLAVVSVAVATTTHLSFDVKDGVNPVSKVVKLLTDMQKQLKAEKATDEENYEKLSCWCETNNKDKTAAIEQYEATVKDLESEIESRTKRAERLADQIKAKQAEVETTQQSIYSAEEQREEEGRKNQKEMVEMTSNIEALKGAVVVLKKHQLTAFPQMKLNFLSVRSQKHALNPEDDLDRLSAWMTQHRFASLPEASEKDIETAVSKYVNHDMKERKTVTDYSASELSMLAKAKKLVHTFTQTHTTYAPYANQSGEIFGILTQLLEEMTGDLKALEERDAKSAKESTELLVELKTSLAEAEKMLKNKEMQAAENKKALADAKEALKDT
jgi:chromosome segregation ATPase